MSLLEAEPETYACALCERTGAFFFCTGSGSKTYKQASGMVDTGNLTRKHLRMTRPSCPIVLRRTAPLPFRALTRPVSR